MANRRFYQFYQTLHYKPVQLDCYFTVASSNTSGMTGLKGPGIASVYMHTSGSPAGAFNPANGMIYVQLQDNYNAFYLSSYSIGSPVTGSAISISTGSSLTAGTPYQITSLGTTTTAQWQAVGVPSGITPAVGLTFYAIATSGSGTGQVKAMGVSGVNSIELLGNPNLSISSTGAAVMGVGSPNAYIALQCLGPTNSSTTTQIAKAPADGSLIYLKFILGNSSLMINGD